MTTVEVGLILDDVRGSWKALAACRGRTGLFFAEDTISERIAVAVCKSCPVREPCLAEARLFEGPWKYGVRGGLTPAQRGGRGR